MFGEGTAGERLWGARVTADFFNVLGVKPLIGRFFTLENSRPNEDKVIVLAQSFWTSAVPFQGGLPINALTLAEDTLPAGSAQPGVFITTVSPQYLETLWLRLVEGAIFRAGRCAAGPTRLRRR